MIIIGYLIKEIFKNQFIILIILILIFFCQKLIKIFSIIIKENIPINLILSLFCLSIPDMSQLIMPLSLFLGLLMTLKKLYYSGEITAIYACGFGENVLILAALLISLLTTIFVIINVSFLSPWSSRYQNQVLLDAKTNPNIAILTNGKFQSIENGNSVLFITNINGDTLQNIFLAKLKSKTNKVTSVTIASKGYLIKQPDNSQLIILNHGLHYKGFMSSKDFHITYFDQYKTLINHKKIVVDNNNVEQMTLNQLLNSHKLEVNVEFHWRLTLIISTFIMIIIVVPLSMIKLHQGRTLNILPAMLLYLIFFLLQTLMHSNGIKGKLNAVPWIWFINLIYFIIALILNFRDLFFLRKLRNLITK